MELYAGYHETIGAFLLRFYWEGPASHAADRSVIDAWHRRFEPIEDEV
jgi:hypothetical protein